jgi:glutamate-1-semialdehyde 2,1-aminomutase
VVADTIAEHAAKALTEAGVPHVVQHAGSMFSVFFRDGAVRDYDDARGQDTDAFRRFFHSMLSQGVYLPPSAFEAWFVSAAHDDRAVERVLAALPHAARAAASADVVTTEGTPG